MPKKPKLKRYAEEIKVKGQFLGEPEEVRTRLSKREFEKRQTNFNTFYADELGGYDYSEFVEWGGQNEGAGRPLLYQNPAERQKAYRIRKKLSERKPLKDKDIEWLRAKGIKVEGNGLKTS